MVIPCNKLLEPASAADASTGARRRRVLSALGLAGAGTLCPPALRTALAQDAYPSRPITMISSSGAGSGADLLCRLIAQAMAASLRQQVVVENRPGASGALAGMAVVRARNDGYTLLFGSASGTVISQAMQPKPAFDAVTDLTAIAQIGAGGIPLVVSPRLPVKDMREFIAFIKANPGKYQFASWGIGTTGHLIMEWLKNAYGLQIEHVPYKSVPAIVQDLQGGHIDIAFIDPNTALPLHKAGRIRVLGLSGSRQPAGMRDVPLMIEQGVKFSVDGWYGLFGPRDLPAAITNLLNQEVLKVLTASDMQPRLLQLNLGDTPLKTPEQFARTVREDLAVWQGIVRTNNIRAD